MDCKVFRFRSKKFIVQKTNRINRKNMEGIYESLKQNRYEREEQKKWWDEHKNKLSDKQLDDLFEWTVQEKFGYFPIVVGITLDTAGNVEELITNLERLSEHIDNNLTWNEFFSALEDKLKDKSTQFTRDLYQEILSREHEGVKEYIGVVMSELPEDEVESDVLQFLQSREADKVKMGIVGLINSFKGEKISEKIVEELDELAENPTFHVDILRASMSLLENNPSLWDLIMRIGRNNPSTIQNIIDLYHRYLYGKAFNQAYLQDYLELLEIGLENDAIHDLKDRHLYMDFSNETNHLADFVITLSKYKPISAKNFAEYSAEKNEDILTALFQRMEEFSDISRASEIIFKAGKKYPKRMVNLVIENYDVSFRIGMLKLLQKSIGELYFSSKYERDIAISIANFLESLDEPTFCRPMKREKIEKEIDDIDDKKDHNKDVFYHLHNLLYDYLNNRKYDHSTLNKLNSYPKLKSHFENRLSKKIDQKTFHPMLEVLDFPMSDLLQFLEKNWDKIPQAKRQALLGPAFETTLSEIYFLIWAKNRDLNLDSVDVNLHSYEDGEEMEKDVDVVLDGYYIEIYQPELWRELEVSNSARMVPNRASKKILNKFRNDLLGSEELSQKSIFIALDIRKSEIQSLEIISSLYGGLNVRIIRDQETGEIIDEGTVRDPEDSIKGWKILDKNLNGVIWYIPQVKEDDEGDVVLDLDGKVVPNPRHKNDDNFEYCETLNEKLFDELINPHSS